MSRETIEKKVKDCFASIAKLDNNLLKMDENLFDSYGIDSMKAIKLVSDVEVEFDIDILDEEAQNLLTLKDVVDLISRKLRE